MTFVSCSMPEQFVNPLFEVFDEGDFVLSSYRDVEESLTRVRIFLEDQSRAEEASLCLRSALALVGAEAPIETGELPDEDWRFSYRRHFKIDEIGSRLVIVPEWDVPAFNATASSRLPVVLDPGLAFGTGKHETTRACLEYIDELAQTASVPPSFLDMGCGSGILSIAAAKLGLSPVRGFDVDPEAVDAARENAGKNGVEVDFFRHALGRAAPDSPLAPADLVAANILGPLLIRFADEIVPCVGRWLIVSGILTELYPEVLAAYRARGLDELSRKTLGEWTTGLFARTDAPHKTTKF